MDPNWTTVGQDICDRYDASHIMHVEAQSHDDYLLKLRFSPLPDNCEPGRFEARVSESLKHHIPFLDRPFPSQRKISEWVLDQLPSDLASDGRRLESTFTAAQWDDPEVVALECF